ncbi:MAG: T9SS type A sorting domain-containing protein [Bacteroidetes bacterium]|nr:T9SS type A sorting domain-containing protein [Bacteroidota bacterium]
MINWSSQKLLWGVMPILLLILVSAGNIRAQISSIGGFEGDLPSYWTKGAEPSGSTLEWATDQSRSMGRSLKITKGVTSEAAVWESENVVDFWSPQHEANVDIKIGAWVRTEGVNTNPATEDEKWKVSYTFWDEMGVLIGETVMDLDQSTPSSGAFYADTNGIAETILPVPSWTTIMKFIGGKDATGTVWADDFLHHGRGDGGLQWAGQNWNQAVGVPTGWFYWFPPIGGNDGRIERGFENTVVTTEEAHSGLNSLKFDLPLDRESGDAFVGTKRMLLQGGGGMTTGSGDISALDVNPGDYIRISVWLKANNLQPDSAALFPVTYAVGFTYGFWKGVGNNDGFNNIAGYPIDMQFVLPAVISFDWRQYFIDIQVPNDPEAVAMSVRLHAYSRFTGTVYWDDLKVEKTGSPTNVEDATIPIEFSVTQNYPNPFNPSTTIKYSIPQQSLVTIKVYDILGTEVKTLVNGERTPGIYSVQWNGDNNYGSKVATGIYIYRVVAGNFVQVKKMILMK